MMWCMRTTLTLDPDVATMIEQVRRERHASLRDVVNDALRRGLTAAKTAPREPFVTRAVDLGSPWLPNIDDIADVLEQIEDGS